MDPRVLRRLDALLTLPERGRAAAGHVTREAFCRAVLEAACAELSAEEGVIWLSNGGSPRPLAAVGPRAAERLQGRAVPGEPFASEKLIALEEPMGTLALYRSSGGCLDELDKRFLSLLARETALALHQIELLESQESFSLEMLQVLARAAEAKDQALGNSEKSRALAGRVARAMGLSPLETRHVEYGAMLHRVGKIGVDQALLAKPGKLSPAEYAQIKKYTTIGHEILSRAKGLEPVARIVLHHQEWHNGKGYPDGLSGDAIPVGARIVAVVNAWEAMMQDRPYRKALSREAAVAELRKGAGTQFDPAVVEAFLKAEA